MEAMSIESLLLSSWEEEGFVGKTRVPIGQSDVDVLAIDPNGRRVRIGESKVREGSQALYLVDDSSLVSIERSTPPDFAVWLGPQWSRWLENLSLLWDEKGGPKVPWLLPADQIRKIEVVFCCNLLVHCDRDAANRTLASAVLRTLKDHPALPQQITIPDFIVAEIIPTVSVVTNLIESVFHRIRSGYGRRFADHFKDLLRELNRYLAPDLLRLPRDRDGRPIGQRKAAFEKCIRQTTVMTLLQKMGVTELELREWLAQ